MSYATDITLAASTIAVPLYTRWTAFLTDDQMSESWLRQFPAVIGGVLPVVNLPGIKAGQTILTGDIRVYIF
jgi:hypothetical protein